MHARNKNHCGEDALPIDLVGIQVNGEMYESPNPTTGEAIYELAGVPVDEQLFRNDRGTTEDELIANDDTQVELLPSDQFYTAVCHGREFTIVVNGRKKTVHQPRLTFSEIVALALDPVPSGPNWVFTITYRNGPRPNPQGTLSEGESVRIQDRMVFNVTATDKS